jgi:hypothetical protein
MSFTTNERQLLGQLADILIPAGGGLPAASQAGVAQAGLDQVIAARPDLVASLQSLLADARGCEPTEFMTQLRTQKAATFGMLGEVVAAAYFLNPTVAATLGYASQTPRPIDPHPDYLDDDLLTPVITRGPIYRPTPK